MIEIRSNKGLINIYENDEFVAAIPVSDYVITDGVDKLKLEYINFNQIFSYYLDLDTIVDGVEFTSLEELLNTISSFNRGGGSGGGATWSSITGKPYADDRFAGLDTNGNLLIDQIPDSLLNPLRLGGLYDGVVVTANDNYPELDGQPLPPPENYDSLVFISTGTYSYDGKEYTDGDWIVSLGNKWDRVKNTDAVSGILLGNNTTPSTGLVSVNPQSIGLPVTANNFLIGTGTGVGSRRILPNDLRPDSQGGALRTLTFNADTNVWTVSLAVSQGNTGSSIVQRTANGRISFADGTNPDNGITLSQLDGRTPVLTQGNFLVGGASGNEQRTILPSDLGLSGNNNVVTLNASGNFSQTAFRTAVANSSIVQRTTTGTGKFAVGVASDDAVVMSQLTPSGLGMNPAGDTGTTRLVVFNGATNTFINALSYGQAVSGGTMAQRYTNGRLRVGTAVEGSDAVNLDQLQSMTIEDDVLTDEQTSATLNAKYPTAGRGVIVVAPNVGSGMAYVKLLSGDWFSFVGQTI